MDSNASALLSILAASVDGDRVSFVDTKAAAFDMARVLRGCGLIEVDAGVAVPVAPGSSATRADGYFIGTPQALLQPAVDQLTQVGKPRLEHSRTIVEGRTVSWELVSVELLTTGGSVNVRGEGSTVSVALADTISRTTNCAHRYWDPPGRNGMPIS